MSDKPSILIEIRVDTKQKQSSSGEEIECKNEPKGPFGILKNALLLELATPRPKPINKISIIGLGNVGVGAAITILNKKISNELAFIDMSEKLIKAEKLEFLHGSTYMKNVKISCSTDYSASKDSRICIITAGKQRPKDKTRLDLAQMNADVLKEIVPNLMKYNEDTILILIVNPVDAMTWVAWKLSGLPKTKVLGTGCMLDSARLQYLLSVKLGIAPTDCKGYVLGEHGESCFISWSSLSVGGTNFLDIDPKIYETKAADQLLNDVIQAGYGISAGKGYTNWGVGITAAQMCEEILKDTRNIYPVTTCVKGMYGISDDIFMSLPCIFSDKGVLSIVKQKFTAFELEKLKKTTEVLAKTQDIIKL